MIFFAFPESFSRSVCRSCGRSICSSPKSENSTRRPGYPLVSAVTACWSKGLTPPGGTVVGAMRALRSQTKPAGHRTALQLSANVGDLWKARLKDATTWDDVIRIAGSTIVGKGKGRTGAVRFDSKEFELALKTRLWEVAGKKKNARNLLSSFCEAHNFKHNWLGLRCAVNFGSRLLEKETKDSSVVWVSEFLYQLGVQSVPGKLGPIDLMPFVNYLVKYVNSTPPAHLLKGLYGAAALRFNGVFVGKLLTKVEENYSDQLHKLSTPEFELLTMATVTYTGKDYCNWLLYLRLMDEFVLRLPELTALQCKDMLCAFVGNQPPLAGLQERLVKMYRCAEGHVLPAVTYMYSEENVADLCLAAARISYKTELVSFKEILLDQIDKLSPSTLAVLCYYVTVHDVVDAVLMDSLLSHIPSQVIRWSKEDLSFLLCAMLKSEKRGVEGAVELINDINKEFDLDYNEQGHTLKTVLSELKSQDNSLFLNPRQLASKTMGCASIIKGMCVLAQRPDTSIVLHFLQRCEGELERDFTDGFHDPALVARLCNMMVLLRWVQEAWLDTALKLLVKRLENSVEHTHCHRFTSKLIGVCMAVSVLNVRRHKFFIRVGKWVEIIFPSFPDGKVQQQALCVNFLWASAVQDVFPMKLIGGLSGLLPKTVEKLDKDCCIRLHELLIVARELHNVKVSPDLSAKLLGRVKKLSATSQKDTLECLHEMMQILQDTHVRLNALTEDGCRIDCMLLTAGDGWPVAWPADAPDQLSVGDIRRLKACSYQPVAVLLLGQEWFYHDGSRQLGTAVMKSRTLEVCGWSVLMLSISAYEANTNKENYLREQLSTVGVLL